MVTLTDWKNHRIINVTTKQIVAGDFGKGGAPNQLGGPTDVVYDRITNSFIIADRGNQRVVRWSNGNSEILMQEIDCWGLALDKYGSLYITDTERCEVRRYTKTDRNGFTVIGGHGQGHSLRQLSYCQGIAVDRFGDVYVADGLNMLMKVH